MPEDGHPRIGQLPWWPWQKREMIVLHQHHRVFFLLDFLQHSFANLRHG
jgi:hypothetical protein